MHAQRQNPFAAFINMALLTCLLAAPQLSATVIPGDLTLANQTEVDACSTITEITGSLLIKNTGVTNLDGLSALESVGDDLDITNNAALAWSVYQKSFALWWPWLPT